MDSSVQGPHRVNSFKIAFLVADIVTPYVLFTLFHDVSVVLKLKNLFFGRS